MLRSKAKICATVLVLAMLLSAFAFVPAGATEVSGVVTDASGWFESAYAEWTPFSGASSY